ncbi:MAG: NAD(P)H-binding protein [Leptospiraceae bacterium]|nr:NAD(P)H-binding protein [Leptospiraceae bacterium]
MPQHKNKKSAKYRILIAGATGLIGSHALTKAIEHPEIAEIHAIVRRKPDIKSPKLHFIEKQYNDLQKSDIPTGLDQVLCCLGTTIAKAGSREKFREVDFSYIVKLAELSHAAGARSFQLISSLGASATSGIFYSKIKGETEAAILQVGFEQTVIYRPSLLGGDRKEHRTGEKIMSSVLSNISFLMVGPLANYKIIQAETIASVMLKVVTGTILLNGTLKILESQEIEKLNLTES